MVYLPWQVGRGPVGGPLTGMSPVAVVPHDHIKLAGKGRHMGTLWSIPASTSKASGFEADRRRTSRVITHTHKA